MSANEIIKDLRSLLPPQVDYAELVCAEGFSHGQHYVWTEPEPYIISAAADCIESLQVEVDGMRSNWYKCAENYQQKCRDIAELKSKLAKQNIAIRNADLSIREYQRIIKELNHREEENE